MILSSQQGRARQRSHKAVALGGDMAPKEGHMGGLPHAGSSQAVSAFAQQLSTHQVRGRQPPPRAG